MAVPQDNAALSIHAYGVSAALSLDPLSGMTRAVRDALAKQGISVSAMKTDTVHIRPGAETSVGLACDTDKGHVYVVASNASLEEDANVSVIAQEPERLVMWRHPADPALPGLACASDPVALEERMTEVTQTEYRCESISFITYRPLRRAVLRAIGPAPFFVKVVRPSVAQRLVEASRLLAELTPECVDAGDGILAYEPAPGEPLIERIAREPRSLEATRLLDAVDLVLDSLPEAVMKLPANPSWTDRRSDYAQHAINRGMNPEQVRGIVEDISAVVAVPAPLVPTHADLHVANLWVDKDPRAMVVTNVIDVDTVGPGVRADDYGCLIAHVAALRALEPVQYGPMPALARELALNALARPDGESSAARAAAVLLSLASTTENSAHAEEWMMLAQEYARLTLAASAQ